MKTVTIWRVEHPNTGEGPYEERGWEDHDHDTCIKHPNIEDDGIDPDLWDYSYYFGFASSKALCKWFSLNECKRLNKLGYRIVTLKVPEHIVVYGKSQLMFKRSKLACIS